MSALHSTYLPVSLPVTGKHLIHVAVTLILILVVEGWRPACASSFLHASHNSSSWKLLIVFPVLGITLSPAPSNEQRN